MRRDEMRWGLAGWALGITVGVVLSAGVCAAGQLEGSGVSVEIDAAQIEAPQIETSKIETPIDATMARLRQMEKIPGFDLARLSAASRNLFSLADRWTAVRERLLKGASAFAASAQTRSFVATEMPLTLGTDLRRSRYFIRADRHRARIECSKACLSRPWRGPRMGQHRHDRR